MTLRELLHYAIAGGGEAMLLATQIRYAAAG